jgi:8-oxo-dGTP diphosphatase
MKLRNMTVIYIINNDKILLMYRVGSRVFSGALWVGIGGHFEQEELNEPEKCILRELFEETGITENDISDLKLKYITMRKAKEEIRLQYVYFANLKNEKVSISPCDEGEVTWQGIDRISGLKMSFTNGECLKHYFEKGIANDEIYSGVVKVIDNEPEMQFIALRDFDTSY